MPEPNYNADDIVFLNTVEETHFWYTNRRHLVDTLWRDMAGQLPADPLILDLGSGNGSMVATLRRHGRYLGIEFAPEAVANCRAKGGVALAGDARRIPLRADAVDAIMILDLLEHVDDDRRVLAECSRVLRPGGLLLVMVPAFQMLWTSFDLHSFHKRRYSRARLLDLLGRARFAPIRESYLFSFLFPVLLATTLRERLQGGQNARDRGWRRRLTPPKKGVNDLLAWLGRMEVCWMQRGRIPFGSTLVALCRNTK
jgi:SAM-dependent methyltransferase